MTGRRDSTNPAGHEFAHRSRRQPRHADPLPLRHAGRGRRAGSASRHACAARLFRRAAGVFGRGNAGRRKSLRPAFRQRAASDVCRPYRRRAARRRDIVAPSAVFGRGGRRRDVRARRGRHEGRHRLLRGGGCAPRRAPRQPWRLGVAADHRRRGRPLDQRHAETAGMGGRQGRELGRGDRRRADQPERARRHDQDRPARLAFRRGDGQGRAGALGLPASGRQRRARRGDAGGRAARSALRRGHRRIPGDEPRDHHDRHRQPGGQRAAGEGDDRLQRALQRQLDRRQPEGGDRGKAGARRFRREAEARARMRRCATISTGSAASARCS